MMTPFITPLVDAQCANVARVKADGAIVVATVSIDEAQKRRLAAPALGLDTYAATAAKLHSLRPNLRAAGSTMAKHLR